MIEPTIEGYQQLLKQFYRKTIRTHPKRHDLITKFIKISTGMKDQKPQEPQTPRISSPRSRATLNIIDIRESQKNKSASSRDNEPMSAKLSASKKYSDDRSLGSRDSEDCREQKKNRDQEKYFNCEWVYKSASFKKTLAYACVYLYFQLNDVYSFTKLKDNVEIYIDQSIAQNDEPGNWVAEWVKLDQAFQKKDRVRWTKILHQTFGTFPVAFISMIFESLTRVRSSQDLKNPTKDQIDSISKYVKVNINYFEIFCQQIEKMYEKSGSFKIDINIGYVKEEDVFVFANRLPQKSEQEKKKDKAIKNISESIANLLKEYDANTEKLLSLDILSDGGSKQANTKSYISKRDGK